MYQEKKYPALRFISSVYRFFAIIAIIIALVVPVYIVVKGNELSTSLNDSSNIIFNTSMLTAIYVFFGVGLGALTLLAVSEGIMVFIDIENNTRKSGFVKYINKSDSNDDSSSSANTQDRETSVNPDFFERGDDEEINDSTGRYKPSKKDVFVHENDIYEFLKNHKFKSKFGYMLNYEDSELAVVSPKGRKLQFVNVDVLNGYKDNFAKIKGKFIENDDIYTFEINSEKGVVKDYNDTIYYAIS